MALDFRNKKEIIFIFNEEYGFDFGEFNDESLRKKNIFLEEKSKHLGKVTEVYSVKPTRVMEIAKLDDRFNPISTDNIPEIVTRTIWVCLFFSFSEEEWDKQQALRHITHAKYS